MLQLRNAFRGPSGQLAGPGYWIIKDDHHTVASVAFERAAVFNDDLADGRVVVAQQSHHVFGV